ncbi:hypothetical protein ACFQOZ_21390 [Comamonas endophytica]|uniref:hypothetical protein n=1 Tax=Comamonas endophytica TaxID=2949090 RepID=UPI0036173CD3
MRFCLFISFSAALFLSACAAPLRSSSSYVDSNINAADAITLANDAAVYLSKSLSPAKTMLVIDPPPTRNVADELTPAMQTALREKGYGVLILSTKNPEKKKRRILRQEQHCVIWPPRWKPGSFYVCNFKG